MLAYFIIYGGVGQADLPRFRDSGLYCIPVCLGSLSAAVEGIWNTNVLHEGS